MQAGLIAKITRTQWRRKGATSLLPILKRRERRSPRGRSSITPHHRDARVKSVSVKKFDAISDT
jgi:hypothetical protein